MSGPITATQLLAAWEAELDEPATRRAVALLAGCRGSEIDGVARWTVAARDAALFDLRVELFGATAPAVVDCPDCAERLEVELDLSALRPEQPPAAPPPVGLDEVLRADVHGYAISAHRPNTVDVLAACASSVHEHGAVAVLLERCVESVRTPAGDAIALATVPGDVGAEIRTWLSSELDRSEVQLAMECDACGHAFDVPFDIGTFLVADVDAWAERTLDEVHRLAGAYGWTEPEVLALPARRRRRYLDIIDSTRARA